MRNECNIIRDILPLYAEDMVSDDTADYVNEHLEKCEACRKELEQIKKPQTVIPATDKSPLISIEKKLKAKRIQTIVLTAVFVAAILVSAFAVLDAPIYLPYTEDLMTVEPIGDGYLEITFDESVTDFDYNIHSDPESEGMFYICDVEAWTSTWDKWFSKGGGKLSTTVYPREPYPITVMYTPNDGGENIFVYGENTLDGGCTVLPRASLGFYLAVVVIALAVLIAAWFVLRKKDRVRVWVERIALYPIAYIISHFIVSGFSTVSYSLQRNFSLIVLISLLLYCALLLVHNILSIKREIKQLNKLI